MAVAIIGSIAKGLLAGGGKKAAVKAGAQAAGQQVAQKMLSPSNEKKGGALVAQPRTQFIPVPASSTQTSNTKPGAIVKTGNPELDDSIRTVQVSVIDLGSVLKDQEKFKRKQAEDKRKRRIAFLRKLGSGALGLLGMGFGFAKAVAGKIPFADKIKRFLTNVLLGSLISWFTTNFGKIQEWWKENVEPVLKNLKEWVFDPIWGFLTWLSGPARALMEELRSLPLIGSSIGQIADMLDDLESLTGSLEKDSKDLENKVRSGGGRLAGGAGPVGAPGSYDVSQVQGGEYGEASLIQAMNSAGIVDPNERAMFLAQMRHESGNFKYDEEIGGGHDYYDGGKRYRGRGYIQLTHKYNYKKYGDMLGIDLVNNPDLAKDPKIAAQIAILYWKERVNKEAARGGDVSTVTRNIQGGQRGLSQRQAYYDDYLRRGVPAPTPSSFTPPTERRPVGELPPTGLIPGQNYGASRDGGSRKHAGQDYDISGPNATFSSQIGGVVTHVGYDPNPYGYGHYADIYNEELNVTERIAEGAQLLVKKGDRVAPGQVVTKGETYTGVIHYEIRKGKATTFGYANTVDPKDFLRNKRRISAVSTQTSYERPRIQYVPRIIKVLEPAAPQPVVVSSSGGVNSTAANRNATLYGS